MKKFIIGIDIDGCLGDYYDSLRTMVADKVGVPRSQVEDIYPNPKYYDMKDWPDFEQNFVKYHTEAVMDGLFLNMKPILGASEVLWRLNDEGHHLRVITSRFVKHGQNAKVISDTAYWLDKHDIPYRDIMFVRHKPDVYADVYIDDSPENLAALSTKGRQAIIFNAGYNQELIGRRAQTWEDVYNHVEELSRIVS
jgi:5'(3')-deoxyribonucleotidase